MADLSRYDVELLRKIQYGWITTISQQSRDEREQVIRLQSRGLISVKPVTRWAADVTLTKAGWAALARHP